MHQEKSVLYIKFYVYDLSNKKLLLLVLNEARDGAQRTAGDGKFYGMGAGWGRALSPCVLSLVLGTHSRLLCPRAESSARLVPLQQTTEILRSEAVQGFVHEDQDLVVHTGRHREPVQLPAHNTGCVRFRSLPIVLPPGEFPERFVCLFWSLDQG